MNNGNFIKTLKSFNASHKVFVQENDPKSISDVVLTEKGIVLTNICDGMQLTVGSLLEKLSKYSIEFNVLVGNNPVLFIIEKNEDIFLITENGNSFCQLLSETVSSLLEDETVTEEMFYAELSEIGITIETIRKYFGEKAALQMENFYKKECINAIDEWCKNFIKESGIDHIRPEITLGKYSKYGIYIDSIGIMVTHPNVWYTSEELGRENNLIGQELIARWDEIRTVLIYQADMKNIRKQDIETFDVGAPYSRKKGKISC